MIDFFSITRTVTVKQIWSSLKTPWETIHFSPKYSHYSGYFGNCSLTMTLLHSSDHSQYWKNFPKEIKILEIIKSYSGPRLRKRWLKKVNR